MSRFLITTVILTTLLITSCKKEPDSPPITPLTTDQIITIDSLRNWETNVGPVSITTDLSVYGIVTMDESSGNIYKQLYIQDHTAAIQVRLLSSSDFRVGDSVRIALNGAYLSEYAGVIQLDSIDPTKQIILQSKNHPKTPQTFSVLTDITLADEAKLIKLENVQFQNGELTQTFADAVNQSSENRIIEDCDGNTIIVRTSGFANFAGTQLPQGNGTLVAIVNQFNGELQLIVRSYQEINMNGSRCAGQLLFKDFDDNSVTSGGWIVQQVIGTETWTTSTLGGAPDPYGVIDNFNGSNSQTESWLISPALDLSSSSSASMSFLNACNYNGAALQLLISTNYSGTGDPNGATWTSLTANWSTGSWLWVESGLIDLSAYLQSNVRIAFKYTGSNSDGKTWEIDDIEING